MTKRTDTPLFDEMRYNEIVSSLNSAIAQANQTINEPRPKSAMPLIEETRKSTILKNIKKAKPRYKRRGA